MATKQIAWQTGSGNITLTYQGQGDGTISVQSDENNGAARSQVITVQTLDGVVTRNLTVSQVACPIPEGTVLSYAYTGSYQEVTLPAGKYNLQCWGAQGGSNAADSSYGITAQAGGKGGYSEGIITLSQKTTVRVYVGGQGSSSAGGFNGGGSTSGSSTYNSGDTYGTSRMGGGGGATDIRLSDGALLSRMIVAGGGSGGAMCYQNQTITDTVNNSDFIGQSGYIITSSGKWINSSNYEYALIDVTAYRGKTFTLNRGPHNTDYTFLASAPVTTDYADQNYATGYTTIVFVTSDITGTVPQDAMYMFVGVREYSNDTRPNSVQFTYTVENTDYQTGFVGGGTIGGGYPSTCQGKQNAAGTRGSFGQGANQDALYMRYCSGAGGGGWYGGGGGQKSDSDMTYCKYSGGGSGFVNTAASAGNRPSGYTGLQLDSGSTTAGSSSFPAPGGGNETGHSGNGYARITRIS